MSIIHEALKKARQEDQSIPVSGSQEALRKNLRMQIEPSRSRWNWGPLFVIVVLLLITGPIVVPSVLTVFKPAGPAPAERPATRKAQFGIEETGLFRMAPSLPKAPDLRLTGIVYSPKGSFCIINDSILKAGDTIKGATVMNVTAQNVTLENQGKQITLQLA
ncbi:MAG: hypothetical protein ACREH5_06530 [Candidatus Omnitrophota bacterium]